MKMNALALIILLCGCELTRLPVDPHLPPVPDDHDTQIIITFDRAAASEALSRLAERCDKSAARRATVELDGTLTEMVLDGAPADYAERVRVAVPSIGSNPARDLDASEIETLRGVR